MVGDDVGEKEETYLAWHYIQIEMTPIEKGAGQDGAPDNFRQCLNALTSNSAGIYFEIREYSWSEGEPEYCRCTIDVYLNDGSALDKFIAKLKEDEDALTALKTVIDQQIAQNPEDPLIFAAQNALVDLHKAHTLGIPVNAIAYHIKQVLINPTVKNIKQLKQSSLNIQLGKRQLGLTILGSIIAFIGVTCFALALPLILTGVNTPVGISLLVAGIGILASGLARIYSAREKGLRSSVHCFYNKAVKVGYDDSLLTQEERLLIGNNV